MSGVVYHATRLPQLCPCYLSTPWAVSNTANKSVVPGLLLASVGEAICFDCESTPFTTLSIVLMALTAARMGIMENSIGVRDAAVIAMKTPVA